MRADIDIPSAAVIGWPIDHSLSPRIHNYWLRQLHARGRYTAVAVAPEDLNRFMANLAERGFTGVNVTVPHKESVLPFMDDLSPPAERIGAVNMVTVLEGGHLLGENSDGIGFIDNLSSRHPDRSPAGMTVCLLGAGGAARAIADALLSNGAEAVTVCNRTRERADALVDHFADDRLRAADWEDREACLRDCDLLINATALGMKGQPALSLSLDSLPEDALVADIVYAPLETPLLCEARRRGNPTVDGLGMLLYQARPAFERWFGETPDVDEDLRTHMLKALESD